MHISRCILPLSFRGFHPSIINLPLLGSKPGGVHVVMQGTHPIGTGKRKTNRKGFEFKYSLHSHTPNENFFPSSPPVKGPSSPRGTESKPFQHMGLLGVGSISDSNYSNSSRKQQHSAPCSALRIFQWRKERQRACGAGIREVGETHNGNAMRVGKLHSKTGSGGSYVKTQGSEVLDGK